MIRYEHTGARRRAHHRAPLRVAPLTRAEIYAAVAALAPVAFVVWAGK